MEARRPISVFMVVAAAIGGGGCATPLTSDSTRIDRCVTVQREKLGDRYTADQLRTACTQWNTDGQLGDDGIYHPPRT